MAIVNCPICQKRKAKRFCPARGEKICPICCGTEREVSIDCPPDCSFLASSREYEWARQEREFDWSKLPFPEFKVPPSFEREHGRMLDILTYAVCAFASEHRPLVDADVMVVLQALAENYRTLSNGLYYEKPPDYVYQRQLYDALKAGIEEYKKTQAQGLAGGGTRDSDIRDGLIILTQLGARHSNGRPKGRTFLDLLRSQFSAEEFRPQSKIVLP